jgi:hypothetical protein
MTTQAADRSPKKILMSQRANAPYYDRVYEDGITIEYEGHDVPKRRTITIQKAKSQRGVAKRVGIISSCIVTVGLTPAGFLVQTLEQEARWLQKRFGSMRVETFACQKPSFWAEIQ